jgi:hypothetical protein
MYYEQVIIKSEEDLPKEDGEYFVFVRGTDNPDLFWWIKEYENTDYWMSTFSAYLIPISDEDVVGEITPKWNAEQSSLLQELP